MRHLGVPLPSAPLSLVGLCTCLSLGWRGKGVVLRDSQEGPTEGAVNFWEKRVLEAGKGTKTKIKTVLSAPGTRSVFDIERNGNLMATPHRPVGRQLPLRGPKAHYGAACFCPGRPQTTPLGTESRQKQPPGISNTTPHL